MTSVWRCDFCRQDVNVENIVQSGIHAGGHETGAKGKACGPVVNKTTGVRYDSLTNQHLSALPTERAEE